MGTQARLAALLVGCALAARAAADAYVWTDAEGTVHYEQAPPSKAARVRKVPMGARGDALPAVITPSPDTSEGSETSSTRASPARREAKPKRVPHVELYTTSWCPWCEKARAYFRSRGVSFTEHDIEAEEGALERKLGLDGDKRVPTAIIGGKVVRGYSPSGYQAALEGR